MPKFRTTEYNVWRSCERMGVRPPGVAESWDECTWWAQSQLLAFEQIRQHEGG